MGGYAAFAGHLGRQEAVSKTLRVLYHNAQPSLCDQGRQGYGLCCDGMGFVKVSEDQVSVKD
jgi:hypothetical protein